MPGVILVVNAGSSSIKFSAYRIGAGRPPALQFKGQVEGIGSAPHMMARDANGTMIAERRWPRGDAVTHEAIFEILGSWVREHVGGDPLLAVGHRIVHGGPTFAGPVRIDAKVLADLEALCPLAPLHQPHNLAAVRAITATSPALPQVACFDTAFHHGQPALARRFALPRELHDAGIRRYGFHGLSYDYIASALRARAPAVAAGSVIVAHLGAGASLCAMADGRSVDTTMGFTALDGLPMATRCGSLDPGVLLHLLQARGMTAETIEKMLYQKSGLLGVSGISGDMRELLASEDSRAGEAVELFVYRIAREIGALTASLGGLDALVFTAGIGEHAPEIRRRVCERIAWLGVALDAEANARGAERISTAGSRISVWALPTDEELTIVRQTVAVLGLDAPVPSTQAAGAV
ncbi:MAG TPA: acetate/propionate family kinase [Alphaproteobacteria bacterium]|nr:acetate/propionate family kinase [Alphaproteobacteria bacterium]